MKKRDKRKDSVQVELWLLDGFLGILALMIYNFSLYLLSLTNVISAIRKTEKAVGYFGLNTFIDFSYNPAQMMFGVIIVFIFSFALGIGIGKLTRKYRGDKNYTD